MSLNGECAPEARERCADGVNVAIMNAKQVRLASEDITSIVEIEHHAQVQAWLYDHVHHDLAREHREYRAFFRKLPTNRQADILVAKRKGQVVGFLGLWRRGDFMEHVATIGVSVHPGWWGRGVATRLIEAAIELARERGLERLEIETLAENAPMRRVAEKLGFTLEGLRKNRIRKDGSYHDEVTYAMFL